MKKLENKKYSFNKKALGKLAPAAVVIAAVAAAGVQTKGDAAGVATETKSTVDSQDIESLLQTAFFSDETVLAEAAVEKETADEEKNSSAKKTSNKKKIGSITKGSAKTLPAKSAAASGQGQGTTTTPTTEVPEGGYKDGVYQGSGTGFGGTITVQVTVSGGKITAVDILSAAGETSSYFSRASSVVSEVLSSQSPNVDAVGGATYSSNGIIQAVQNALSQAGNAKNTPTPTPKPVKTPKPGKTDKNVIYKDGVYKGQAEGFDGMVTVKVTIKNGKITKITNTNTDTEAFFGKAWKIIKAEILSRQSVSGIDTVSGATYSSNGILQAAEQALLKAQESKTANSGTSSGDSSDNNSGENMGDTVISPAPSTNPDTPTPVPGNAATVLKDGIYTASAQGYSGLVNITITIKDGKITEIANTNSDTRSFFNKAWRKIQPEILEKQNAEGIDTVNGATFSSLGILDASKSAIEQAKITSEPTVTPTPAPEADPAPSPTPTPAPEASPEPSPTPTQTPEASPEPSPTPTPAPEADPAPSSTPTPTPTPESSYIDGTYTGIGEGNDGSDSVRVTITISGGKLTNAVYSTYDDEEYFAAAWNGILSQILGKQSAEGIDAVNGSTYSSLGIIQAFQNALKQAKGA